MARGRRIGRFLALLVVVLVAFLLLEMNRFFPGSWPGGGGTTGLRTESTSGVDPERVRPTTPGKPPLPQDPVVSVVVRTAEGAPAGAGAFRGWGGPSDVPSAEGSATLPPSLVAPGFVFAPRGGEPVAYAVPPSLRPPDDARASWVAARPAAPVPRQAEATTRDVRVVDEHDAPIAGAAIEVEVPTGARPKATTDADGRASFAAFAGAVRVCATAAGKVPVCVWTAGVGKEPLVLRLDAPDRRPDFRDPETGEPVVPTLPPTDLVPIGDAVVHVRFADRPPIRITRDALRGPIDVPRGRAIELRLRDASGKAVTGAVVRTEFAESDDAERASEPILEQDAVDPQGRLVLRVPQGREAEVRIEAKDFAPASVRLGPTGADPVEVTMQAGVAVPVRVFDDVGKPLGGASIRVLARAGDANVWRHASTRHDGRVLVPPVAPGATEIYVHGQGFAWASARIDVKEGMAPVEVRLARGFPLRLVVGDPLGVPLDGVRVRSAPRADRDAGRPDVGDPAAPPWRTNGEGLLELSDLPDRELDLYLSKPGYHDERLLRVRPGNDVWFATLVPR